MSRSIQLVLLSAVILSCVHFARLQCSNGQTMESAMLCALQPFMKEMREDLSSIRRDLSTLNESVSQLSGDLGERKNDMAVELGQMREGLNSIKSSLNQLSAYTCGGTAGWRRVVYLDMTDPNTDCPSGWQLTGHSIRTCGRVSRGSSTCDSVTFPVSGGEYTRVCGRIKAYQKEQTDGFEAYHLNSLTTINGAYVGGVSLTYGSPREHIWTFAAGATENEPTYVDSCPCDTTLAISIPPFVGEDYFCESGVNSGGIGGFHPDDPLWDGQGCISTSSCCSFNSPPYFTKRLPNPTNDDIEARICQHDPRDDTPVEIVELYVK